MMSISLKELDNKINNVITYSTYKSNKDSNGIYTTVEHKREDGTLCFKSTLSGGTSPKYTTRTETYYAGDGITIINTKTYLLTYDTDGMPLTEVLQ